MKALFAVLTLTLAFAATAHANDGGMAYIDVQGISPVSTEDSSDKKVVVQDGSVIEFYGLDAEKFLRLLPTDRSALTSMVPKDEAELYSDLNRGLMIASKNYGIFFNCWGATAEPVDKPDGSSTYKIVKSPQVKCTISFSKHAGVKEYGGDIFPLDTKDKSQRTCN